MRIFSPEAYKEESYIMKIILLCSILFCTIAIPALGELTVEDIEKIDEKIQASETRIKEYINIKNESIEKRLSLVTTLIVGLMALIGIPIVALTVMIGWQSVKNNTPEKKNEVPTPKVEITHRTERSAINS